MLTEQTYNIVNNIIEINHHKIPISDIIDYEIKDYNNFQEISNNNIKGIFFPIFQEKDDFQSKIKLLLNKFFHINKKLVKTKDVFFIDASQINFGITTSDGTLQSQYYFYSLPYKLVRNTSGRIQRKKNIFYHYYQPLTATYKVPESISYLKCIELHLTNKTIQFTENQVNINLLRRSLETTLRNRLVS